MNATHTVADVRHCLEQIPELMALLPAALLTKPTGVKTRRPVPGSRPPVNLAIVHLADRREKEHFLDVGALIDPDRMGVLPYLDGWCRDLEVTAADGDPIYGVAPREVPPVPEVPTIAGCCNWLLSHLEWAESLPQWPELSDGIRVTHRRLREATRSVRDREEQGVPCNRCGAGKLRHVEGERPLWVCDACDHLETVQAVTLPQAARITKASLRTLQDWARRPGLLTAIGEGPRSRLFDLGQIRALVAERKLRQGA